jgi:hypothetical protein
MNTYKSKTRFFKKHCSGLSVSLLHLRFAYQSCSKLKKKTRSQADTKGKPRDCKLEVEPPSIQGSLYGGQREDWKVLASLFPAGWQKMARQSGAVER